MDLLGAFAIYILISLVIVIPLVLYLFAAASRKSYRCPKCGEQITAEYLEAKHCNMCGAPLNKEEV